MGYMIFFLTLLLFVALGLLLTKYKKYISNKSKIIIGVCLLLIAALIAVYNVLQDKKNENLNLIKNAFIHKIPIECHYQSRIINVNSDDFNISYGTMSFQGKHNTSSSHIVIPLQDCNVQEQPQE